jgi:hypothetical protein
VANLAEKHTVDRGEGAPAIRAISAIPIAAKSTIELKKDGYQIMLLQVRQILAPGARSTAPFATTPTAGKCRSGVARACRLADSQLGFANGQDCCDRRTVNCWPRSSASEQGIRLCSNWMQARALQVSQSSTPTKSVFLAPVAAMERYSRYGSQSCYVRAPCRAPSG